MHGVVYIMHAPFLEDFIGVGSISETYSPNSFTNPNLNLQKIKNGTTASPVNSVYIAMLGQWNDFGCQIYYEGCMQLPIGSAFALQHAWQQLIACVDHL